MGKCHFQLKIKSLENASNKYLIKQNFIETFLQHVWPVPFLWSPGSLMAPMPCPVNFLTRCLFNGAFHLWFLINTTAVVPFWMRRPFWPLDTASRNLARLRSSLASTPSGRMKLATKSLSSIEPRFTNNIQGMFSIYLFATKNKFFIRIYSCRSEFRKRD